MATSKPQTRTVAIRTSTFAIHPQAFDDAELLAAIVRRTRNEGEGTKVCRCLLPVLRVCLLC